MKVGNHCMQLAVAIEAKEVGIGWPWVTCTIQVSYLTYNDYICAPPPPPPPSCKQAVKDDLLVGQFISEFCSMLTINGNGNVLRVLCGGPHQSKSGAAHSSCNGDGKWNNTIPPGWG